MSHRGSSTARRSWMRRAQRGRFPADARTGFRGGLNWYRNQDRNWELSAAYQGAKIDQPALFISGDRDMIRALPDWERGMRNVVTGLRDPVILPGIGHWTQQEAPDRVNRALIDFLASLD